MFRLLLLLTAWCCLLPRAGNSQPTTARSYVVRLDSGEVAKRPLIGLDTTTYQAVRREVARLPVLEHGRDLDRLAIGQLEAELRRCRAVGTDQGQQFTALAGITQQALRTPTPPPLLLDPRFYKGVAGGAVLAFALKFFLL